LSLCNRTRTRNVPYRTHHRKAFSYFSLRIYCEDPAATAATASPALFATEPHDILPIGIFAFSGKMGYFPNHDSRGCISSACFVLPGNIG
jgi:hypothetical protein